MQVAKIHVQRTLMSATISIVLAVALSACGGGGEGSTAAAGLEASTAKTQSLGIVQAPPKATEASQTPHPDESAAVEPPRSDADTATATATQDDGPNPATADTVSSTLSTKVAAASEVPAWAKGATYYVNPLIGSDSNSGLSRAAPRRTLSNAIKMDGVTVLLKRGTTIELRSNLYVRDTYIGGYGGSSIKPRVVVPEGYEYSIGVDSGRFKMSGITLAGNATTRTRQAGVGGTKASSISIEDCDIQDFANGIAFAGVGSVIRNNRITRIANNGINGGSTKSAAPSEALITGNYIDVTGAQNDGITLHDGTGIGFNNRITRNTIVGTNRENAIDIQEQYADTLIEENTLDGSGSYSILLDHLNSGVVELGGTIIRKNTIRNGTSAAIYTRRPNVVISENVITAIRSVSLAAAVAVEASARIVNNTIEVPPENMRSVFNIVQTTGSAEFGGEISGNRVINYSTQAIIGMSAVDKQAMVTLWVIDENSYTVTDLGGRFFLGMDFNQWTSGNSTALKTHADRRSTLSLP